MDSFQQIFDRAAARKGGRDALEAMLAPEVTGEKSATEIAALGDDRLLAMMTRRVFQAGFNWTVIDNKWDGFERAFEGFAIGRWTLMSDEDLDRLLQDTGIVRHAKKIESVRDNAIFLQGLAKEHGSAAKAIAEWPAEDYVGLLDLLKSRASRLGGTSGQYFLRGIGKESFITGGDVARALIEMGVIDKPPSSKGALRKVQDAFNAWKAESGRSLTQISRALALSTGG